MFRLNVIIMNLVEGAKRESINDVVSDFRLNDINMTCTDTVVSQDSLNHKNIGVLITDDENRINHSATEFYYVILVSAFYPAQIDNISVLISPDSEPEYFKFQLWTDLMGIINSYMFWTTWGMLDTTINSTPDLVWYKALDGTHFNVNASFCHTVSKDKYDIEDRKHSYIWNVSEDEAFACQESEEITLKEDKTCSFEELVNTPEGIKTMVTYKTPLRTKKGTLIGTAGIATDVTKQREYEARLHEMASIDPLSGLFNRRKLYEEAVRSYPGEKTVIYIDIDYFKMINDTYGHEKGDKILLLVSRELSEKFADGITARMGGDEFVAVLSGECADAEILHRFELIERSFASSAETEGMNLRLSVGIYHGSLPIEEAIKEADELMYADKRRHHESGVRQGEGSRRKKSIKPELFTGT